MNCVFSGSGIYLAGSHYKECDVPITKNYYHFRVRMVYKVVLTNSMDNSPSWEAKSSSYNQEIPGILWNLKVHYRIHGSLTPVLTPSHVNPVHAPPPQYYFSNSHVDIILPNTAVFPRISSPKHSAHLSYLCFLIYLLHNRTSNVVEVYLYTF